MEIQEIFINRAGRLRSGWRLAIFGVLLFLTIQFAFMLAVGVVSIIYGQDTPAVLDTNLGFVLQGLIMLVSATLVGWACGKLLEDLPPRALGWGFHQGWLRDLLFGSLVGAV
ncbi:MAG TPA: hypothetical protein VJ715_00655, partial [Pyrinomonadaceae bacterium]|nr:hypothetical protein [Pyrinomonadaceae bacterium]